ncbi:MAG: tRNA pseudouridine(38-40) synthase TruA [Actinobacteria bacterium]|nr:tRNA pseudouridine(38-40) synthase TruA [Actinomycetota bacterium]
MSLVEPTVGAPERSRVRVRLVVAYDGGAFRGFAANAGVPTVGGALADALGRVLGRSVELTCAGRTDAGVHAWGQVVTFDAPEGFDAARLQRSVNGMCGPDVVVRSVAVTEPGFDARFSARSRRYRYVVLNRPVPDPFLARTSWWVPEPLDLAGLQLACDPFLGEHDFSAFCRRPKRAAPEEPASLVRRVLGAGWHDGGDGILRFEIEASAFCHQMVRSIVGTLVAVGRRSMRAGDVAGVIRSRDRARAGQLAPPHGLCLWSVAYDGWCS